MTSNGSPKENLSTEITKASSSKGKDTISNKRPLLTLCTVILLISLTCVFFLWMMSQNNRLQEYQTTLNQQMKLLNQQVEELKEAHVVMLNKTSQKHKKNDAWILTKARKYLELAYIEAHWNGVTDTIIALLQQTDTTLSEVTQHDVVEIRKALGQALIQLKSANKIDIERMLNQLDAIQIQVGELKSKPIIPSLASEIKKAKPDAESQSPWRDGLQNSVDILKKLVVVRSQDETATPMLSQLHIKIIQENIRFALQEAEMGLLMRNEKIYSMALTKAIHQINDTFDANSQAVQVIIQQLEQLKSTSFAKPAIHLENPLQLMKQLIQEIEGTTP